MTRWKKLGRIFHPRGVNKTQTPVVLNLSENLYRVYFASRNSLNHSEVYYFDIDITTPHQTRNTNLNKEPTLRCGSMGTFDCAGVMPSCVVRPKPETNPQEVWMYYTGWTQRLDVPYHNSIGLAISHDNGETFTKYSEGPLFSSTVEEPYFTGTPFVVIEDNIWKCWYYSVTEWRMINEVKEPRYKISYAESLDGLNWKRFPKLGIDYSSADEGGLCSPSVLYDGSHYHMWFSYRGITKYRDGENSYQIGYATSLDGKIWKRKTQDVKIVGHKSTWDNRMMCYGYVISHDKDTFMFYNGNTFGQEGVGLLIKEN